MLTSMTSIIHILKYLKATYLYIGLVNSNRKSKEYTVHSIHSIYHLNLDMIVNNNQHYYYYYYCVMVKLILIIRSDLDQSKPQMVKSAISTMLILGQNFQEWWFCKMLTHRNTQLFIYIYIYKSIHNNSHAIAC